MHDDVGADGILQFLTDGSGRFSKNGLLLGGELDKLDVQVLQILGDDLVFKLLAEIDGIFLRHGNSLIELGLEVVGKTVVEVAGDHQTVIKLGGLKLGNVFGDLIEALFPEVDEGSHDAVHSTLLHGGEGFTESHRNGGSAHGAQGLDKVIGLRGTELQALEIIGRGDGMLAVAHGIGAGGVPNEGTDAGGLFKFRVEVLPHVALDDLLGLVNAVEHIGEVENVVLGHIAVLSQSGGGGGGHLIGTGHEVRHRLVIAAGKLTGGIHIDLDAAIGLFLQRVGKVFGDHVNKAAFAVAVGIADGVLGGACGGIVAVVRAGVGRLVLFTARHKAEGKCESKRQSK